MTLQQFIAEHGITTFVGLKIRCDSIGVETPSEEDFRSLRGHEIVSSPHEGVVVFDPPTVDVKRKRRRVEGHADPASE